VTAGFLLSSGAEQWIRQYLAYEPAGRLLRPDLGVLAASILLTICPRFARGNVPGGEGLAPLSDGGDPQ
jgi:hypothetical protein